MKNRTYGSRFTAILFAALAAATVQAADYSYTTDSGTITITGYTGTGGNVIIPSAINGLPVTAIRYQAFRNQSRLSSVTIPDSVISIGFNAFAGCTGLTNISISSNATNIPTGAFYGCTNLASVAIPSSVTSIGQSAFEKCTSLANVTIPNSVTGIGDYAFYYCDSLTNVIMPDSIAIIGDGAFQTCGSLASVTLGNSVTNIGGAAFYGCTNLISVAIPDSVINLGWGAFEDCTSLTNVEIGDGISSIENGTFENCTSLASVTIPGSVTSIWDRAFFNCSSLTAVSVPDSVVYVGPEVFEACAGLVSVSIGMNVLSIEPRTFMGCASLLSVTIGSSVTNIGTEAFNSCTSLANLTIPDGVTDIGAYAFIFCFGLTNITVPGSVALIGDQAFHSCSNLTGIYFQGDAPDVGADVFHLADNVIVYYLSGTTGWGLTFGGRPTAVLLRFIPVAVSPSYPAATNTVRPELALSSAFDGTNFLIGIRGDASSPDAVSGQRFSPSGTSIGPLIITGRSMEGSLDGPRVAFGGSNYLMVWTDAATNHSESGSDIYAHFVNLSGSLAGNAFAVSQAAGGQYARGAAYDGTNYLVIWAGAEGLRGRRVSAAGQLLDAELVFTTAEVEEAAAVAHGGGQYLVVWVEDAGGDYATRGRFVSTSGQLGSVLQLSEINSPSYNPISVAYGQGRFLVVWHHKADVDADWNLRGRIVLADGSTAGNELTLTTGPNEEIAWANNVVFDGQHFLLVWTSYAGSPTSSPGTVLGSYWSAAGEPVGATFTIEPAGTGTLGMGLSAGNGKVLTAINRNAFTSASDVWVRLITRPFVEVSAVGPQKIRVAFNGVLQYSTNLQAWTDYTPQPKSPWTNQTGDGAGFFRARVDGQAPGF